MTFEEILPALRNGEVIRRNVFKKKYVIFMQIPANISSELTIGLKSIPKDMKLLLLDTNKGISYHNQVLLYDFVSEYATNYNFSTDDINALDWEIVDITEHYIYE